MLVIHANWTAGALRLWAESHETYVEARTHRAVGNGQTGAHRESQDGADGVAVLTASVPAADRHPFAVPTFELVDVLLANGIVAESHLADPPVASGMAGADSPTDGEPSFRLRLPVDEHGPRPSDRMLGIVGADDAPAEPRLSEFVVPCVTLRSEEALAAILAIENAMEMVARKGGRSIELEFSHSLRYWIAVARLILELLADQRFIPSVMQSRSAELSAAWMPWLHDESARKRAGALVVGMPPAVRAVVDEHAGRPWPILDEAIRTLTDATVRSALIADDFADAVEDRDPGDDAHVAWLQGLLDRDPLVHQPADGGTEMIRAVGDWIAELDDTGQDKPLRIGFMLCEPPVDQLPPDLAPMGEGVRWRLRLQLLGAVEETEEMVDAEEFWRDPAGVQNAVGGVVRNPEELVLAELGRASRVYPLLETALSDAEPTGIDLTTVEASAFLTEFKELLEESGFVVIVPDWWGQPSARIGARLQLEAPELDPAAGASPSGMAAGTSLLGLHSLVQYRWQVAVGDEPLTMEEFRTLVRAAKGGSLVRLHGRWVELKPEQIEAAARFFEAKPGGEMPLLEAIQLAHGAGGAQLGLPVLGMDATGWVEDLLSASSGGDGMPQIDQPEEFAGTLRPYQKTGLSWLMFLDRFGLGACLADDMGLGKTIQLIALLLAERQHSDGSPIGPTLLVVPTSVVANWKREITRFAERLRVHVHHGPDRPVGDRLIERAEESDVVITTYTLVSRDRETLMRLPWHRVVLDEAQYIKNPPTKQTATIRALRTTRRVALTGTPVENRLSELWSIMEFCNPGYLGQASEFRRRFAVPVERHRDQEKAEQLRRLVRPFVLRRLKTDPLVIDDLPPCVTTKEYATLTGEQAALYERAVNEMLGQVGRAEGIQRRGLVLATLVKLKQICNHPAQLEDNAEKGPGVGLLSGRSGKANRLMRMLEEVVATGDKALLFTQFRRMGHLLGAMIQHDLDTEVQFLHGGTPPGRRQKMIDRFQDPKGGVPIFVLSLKAGGIGVNLTAANHVFHYDRWWNPAVENQATDRAFRIGQTRTVHVHKFVCLGTLEERIDAMIEQKMELAQNIIGAGEDWLTELDSVQLRDLLSLRQTAMEVES